MVTVHIKGLDRLIRKTSPDILAGPLKDFFNDAGEVVKTKGKEFAPVDRGTLRDSLTRYVDSSVPPHWAKISTDVTNRGVSYPAVLDVGSDKLGRVFHYRGMHGRAGSPTKGWFTGQEGALGKSINEIRSLLRKAEQAIKQAWDR